MRQGQIWWAQLPAPAGRRPVVLLSRNQAYAVRSAVTVAIITRTIRNIPVEVRLSKEEGIPKECVINCDTILTVGKSCLEERVTALSPGKWAEVVRALKFALNLP